MQFKNKKLELILVLISTKFTTILKILYVSWRPLQSCDGGAMVRVAYHSTTCFFRQI